MKAKIISSLLATERKGIPELLEYMDANGFYESPCSSGHHLCKPGGLAEHSVAVLDTMEILYQTKLKDYSMSFPNLRVESIIITSLLHDLGKMGQYGNPGYVPNILASGKQSIPKPYETNKNLLFKPHEVRSIEIASKFIELTEEESFAIYFHNGLYVPSGRDLSGKERPLQTLLHFSDMWASRFLEV